MFAIKPTPYPELTKTKKEIGLQETLYGLYVDVFDKIEVEWPHIQWAEVQKNMETMTERVENFMARLSKMPKCYERGSLRFFENETRKFQYCFTIVGN